MKLATVILAAGKGTRMNSDLPKVVHLLNGRPLVVHVLELAEQLNSEQIVTVLGYEKEKVIDVIRDYSTDYALQEPQLGTGHAVMQAEELLRDFDGNVLVLYGDVPLLRKETMESLIKIHEQEDASATILSAIYENPTGYGRIIRSTDESVKAIVEHKDCDEEQIKVKEINSGIIIFKGRDLFEALNKISNNNSQGEYYLTSVIEVFVNENKRVSAMILEDQDEIAGINSPDQLKEAEEILNKRNS
jgi:bifunctional UDP-N-acetylglucosamine pyrophosphorylase / glucosamine-1-phosphate N-acetyltransferase